MKVKGKQRVEIDIDEYEVKAIVRAYLYEKFNWNADLYVKDGNVFESIEYATSHRFEIEEFRREATKEDTLIFELLKLI